MSYLHYISKFGVNVMKVGYAVLYDDGTLVISKNYTLLQKKIIKDYWEFEDTNVPWKRESNKIESVHILDQVKSRYMKSWFKKCNHLTTLINFKNLDTSDCTNFSNMFAYCELLKNINELEELNVSNGRKFSDAFYHCKTLQNIEALKNWNVSNGINFTRMFECTNIYNVFTLENWDVSNCTDFSDMFSYCTSLKEISLSNTLDILNKDMFFNCNPNLKIHWKKHIYIYTDLLEYEQIS